MKSLELGPTKLFNLFHTSILSPELVAKTSKKSTNEAEAGYKAILELRKLNCELDEAVLGAYGWTDLDLGYDFHEFDYLPENDRIRYTISPAARKELLQRLLKLNHERHAQEMAEGATAKEKAKTSKKTRKTAAAPAEEDLFTMAQRTKLVAAEMPASPRPALKDIVLWADFLYEVQAQVQGDLTLNYIEQIWQLLIHRDSCRDDFAKALGPDFEAWRKSFSGELPNRGMIPYLINLHRQGWFSVDPETWKVTVPSDSNLRKFNKNEWMRYDVAAALAVSMNRATKDTPQPDGLVVQFERALKVG